MTNSLRKDSHITQSLLHSQMQYNLARGASKNKRREYLDAPVNNNIGISVRKPAEMNFSGLSSANKPVSNFYTNKILKKFLCMAADSQPLFNATFSILLTCILRPASIMALPSNKKNNDDKKYAAAHSIASGVMAYLISQVIFSPIADSMKKIGDCPEKFLTSKNLAYLKDKKNFAIATKYVNMLTEAALAPPKAIVTVALIPPILKYVFGWEKKKNKDKTESPVTVDYSLLKLPNSKNSQAFNALRNTGGAK